MYFILHCFICRPSDYTVSENAGIEPTGLLRFSALVVTSQTLYTDKKNQIFLIYKEIQSGAVAKDYMRKSFLRYEEMSKYFPIYEEAVSHI